MILAHITEGQVKLFCLSAVWYPQLTWQFQTSSPIPLSQMQQNFTGMILGWSPFKIVKTYPRDHFLLHRLFSEKLKKSSCLNPGLELSDLAHTVSSQPLPSLYKSWPNSLIKFLWHSIRETVSRSRQWPRSHEGQGKKWVTVPSTSTTSNQKYVFFWCVGGKGYPVGWVDMGAW